MAALVSEVFQLGADVSSLPTRVDNDNRFISFFAKNDCFSRKNYAIIAIMFISRKTKF
jgi:hypothetical protein